MLSFHEALIAVRATAIVHRAHLAGELPPSISISLLSGTNQRPKISELKSILDLQHFVRYAECKYLCRIRTELSWGQGANHLIDKSPHSLPSLQASFYRASYRYFISGAVLSRANQETFFVRTDETPDMFLVQAIFSVENEASHHDDQINDNPMKLTEIDHLVQNFPIYDFIPRREWEDFFGHLGDWLVRETEIRLSNKLEGGAALPEQVNSQDSAALREVLQILVLYGQLSDMEGGIIDRQEPFWSQHREHRGGLSWCICQQRDAIQDEEGNSDPSTDAEDDGEDEPDEYVEDDKSDDNMHESQPQPHYRTVPVVTFGTFMAGEIFLPAEDESFVVIYRPLDWSPETLVKSRVPVVAPLCDTLWCRSRRPNAVNSQPSPHPPLHFFAFILRKYFGYQFDELAFEMDSPRPVYANFIRDGKIFTGEGNWDGLLTNVFVEQVLSYKTRG